MLRVAKMEVEILERAAYFAKENVLLTKTAFAIYRGHLSVLGVAGEPSLGTGLG